MFFKLERMSQAVERRDLAAVKKLLEKGVSPDMRDGYGISIAQRVIDNGLAEILEAMLEAGLPPDSRTYKGQLVHFAAYEGEQDCLRLLVERNGDLVHARNGSGDTPLHIAAERGHAGIVAYLLAQGADAAVKNDANRAALYFARENKHDDVIRLLECALKPAVSPQDPAALAERWEALCDDRIACIRTEAAIGYRLTEIFNFSTRERTRLYQNLETKAESVETSGFAEIAEKRPLEDALFRLQKARPAATAFSVDGLHKSKPSPRQG